MSSDIYNRSRGNQNWRKLHFTAIEEKLRTVDNLKERSAVIDMFQSAPFLNVNTSETYVLKPAIASPQINVFLVLVNTS